MTVYTKETALYDTGKIADDISAAGNKAENFITEISNDGIWVTPSDAKPSNGQAVSTTTGWHISSVLEYFKQGASWVKLWVESSVAKLRLGLESSGHVVLDSSGMEVKTDASTSVASLGSTARIGKADAYNVKVTSSKLAFCSSTTELAALQPANRYIYPSAWDAAVDTEYWQDSAYGSIGNSIRFSSVRGYGEDEWGTDFESTAAWSYMLKGHVMVSGSYVQILVRLSDIRDAVSSSYTGSPYAFFNGYSGYWLYYTSGAVKVYTGSSFLTNAVRCVTNAVEGTVMDMSCGIDVHGGVSAAGALSTGNPTLTRGNLGFDSGSVSISATKNAYVDATVAFSANAAFSTAPVVVCGFFSSAGSATFGGLTCAVYGVTRTGCKVRVFNNTSYDRSPAVQWIAIGS